jgi:RNA polymerase sigma-70 factor (ECF subfamily)
VARLDPESLPGHVDRLYRAAWALCGSPHDAEDLVQETFARVLSRPRLLRGDDELAYLMRVLRNTFLSSRRTASRRPQIAARVEELDLPDHAPGDQPEQALEAQAVYGAIAELPEDFRLALVAVDVLGLSTARRAARWAPPRRRSPRGCTAPGAASWRPWTKRPPGKVRARRGVLIR